MPALGGLAHGEDPAEDAPAVADRNQAEAPAVATVPQTRDATVTVHARPGAESDDRKLPLLLGVRVAESDEFLGEAGAQSALVDLGERCVVRDVALEVDILGLDLPGFAAHPLADLDRLEGDTVVGGVDVRRETALELVHRRNGIDDVDAERRSAGIDFADVFLYHDRVPLSVEIASQPDTMSDTRVHLVPSANKHLCVIDASAFGGELLRFKNKRIT